MGFKKKQFFFIIILLIVLLIVSKIYYDIWQERREVKNFIQKNSGQDSIIDNYKKNIEDIENKTKIVRKNEIKEKIKTKNKIPEKEKIESQKLKDKSKHLQNENVSKKESINIHKISNNTENKKLEFEARVPFKKLKINNEIKFKPRFVSTHRSKEKYILFQDEENYLYFLDNNLKLIWKKPLKEKIQSKFYEVDFYKNKKIQFLFTTQNNIFVIDYNGNRVHYYPKEFKDIEYCSLIDYAKNKNYRILLTKKSDSKIFLKDKYFNSLENWSPLELKNSFVIRPFHIRIQNKDYFVCVEKNGTIEIVNRKGNPISGFPLVFKEGIKIFLLLKKNEDENYRMVILTKKDVLYTYDFEGNLKNKTDLKTNLSIEGKISLHIEKVKRNDFIISVSKNYNRKLYNTKFLEIGNITNPPSKNLFFYFKVKNKNFFFTRDIQNRKLLLYNQKGKILTEPIFCSITPKIFYSPKQNSFILTAIKENYLELHKIKIK